MCSRIRSILCLQSYPFIYPLGHPFLWVSVTLGGHIHPSFPGHLHRCSLMIISLKDIYPSIRHLLKLNLKLKSEIMTVLPGITRNRNGMGGKFFCNPFNSILFVFLLKARWDWDHGQKEGEPLALWHDLDNDCAHPGSPRILAHLKLWLVYTEGQTRRKGRHWKGLICPWRPKLFLQD